MPSAPLADAVSLAWRKQIRGNGSGEGERQGYECGGPRPTLKKAFAENLIPTAEGADLWLQMFEDRNLASHAYDEHLAERIYEHIIRDYARLLGSMAHQIQTLAWD